MFKLLYAKDVQYELHIFPLRIGKRVFVLCVGVCGYDNRVISWCYVGMRANLLSESPTSAIYRMYLNTCTPHMYSVCTQQVRLILFPQFCLDILFIFLVICYLLQVGSLDALYFANHGYEVCVFESRPGMFICFWGYILFNLFINSKMLIIFICV